jgi:HAD superfamily hydrolase (TIGR01509 family)
VKYRAVVFDLDGVLWDGEPLYHEAFNVVLAPYGHVFSDEDYVNVIGHSVEYAWAWVLERFQMTEDPASFLHRYNEAVMTLLAQPIEPLPGVRDLLANLRQRRLPIGLASASLRQWVDATISGLGIEKAFDATVSASEVTHSKPAPDLYLKAAERLGLAASDCLAVEDTLSGITSARAAGMYAIQVRAASTALPPLAEADAVIDDYSQFNMALLDGNAP